MNKPFHFNTEADLIYLLGIKAKDPAELRKGIAQAPANSIYYHTHRFLQQHHYLSPEPPNDFAYWLTSLLNLRELGEAMASVDVVRWKDLEELRVEFIRILDGYLSRGKYTASAPQGCEFHFMNTKRFVLPTNCVANNLEEFIDAIRKVSVRSLYFHVFEARMRLKADENDFTEWFHSIGQEQLAKNLCRLDPYTMTLEGLRDRIIREVSRYAGVA
ncbi:MAG: DUF5752 family protein [Candidatus Latescibacterota bacterium]